MLHSPPMQVVWCCGVVAWSCCVVASPRILSLRLNASHTAYVAVSCRGVVVSWCGVVVLVLLCCFILAALCCYSIVRLVVQPWSWRWQGWGCESTMLATGMVTRQGRQGDGDESSYWVRVKDSNEYCKWTSMIEQMLCVTTPLSPYYLVEL